jgi:tRNA (guanine-N7-)-methyltransferase
MCARPLADVLQRYVLPWEQLDWPLNWQDLFRRPAPLVVEVGFGNGAFLIDQAKRRPDANVVGIELSWGRVQRLARRLHDAGLTHVLLIHAEAQVAIQHLFGSNSIDEIFINFPDPWPKKRHYHRRLIQAELIALLADRLAADGRVTIATDHPDYAAWIAAILESQAALCPWFATTAVHELTGRIPTKYEQRARGAQLPVYYFVWHKPGDSAPTTRVQRREVMPHVVLEGPHDLERTLKACTPRVWRETQQGVEVSITLMCAYRELAADSWLVEVMVKEGKLSQQIGVAILPRSWAQVLLKLSAMGFPRPTWGVQRAVWHVAEMLQADNPQLRLIWTSMGNQITSEC